MISLSARKQISGLASAVAATTRCRLTTASFANLSHPIYTSHRPQLAPARLERRSLANTTSNTLGSHAARADKRPANIYEESSDHLPSLPVPNLNETLERLKETIWPVAMNSHEFAQALHLIEAFSASAGQKLDLLLRAKASQTKNWLSHDWWLEEAYLKSRQSLVINSNPAIIYPQLPFEVRDQRQLITTCAQLISSFIECKLAVQRGWNPERASDPQGLCYDQYRRIFASTRLPGEQMDSFKPSESQSDELNFSFVCSFRGQFYEIQLENVSNEQGRVEALESVLSKIIGLNQTERAKYDGPGILTTMRRDIWAHSISLIDPSSLEAIEKAHLMFNLDTIPNEPEDAFAGTLNSDEPATSDKYLGALARQVLHGDRANVGNRWFDKSIQLIVVANADCSRLLGAGINYEHCIGEAIVLTRLIEFSYANLIEQRQRTSPLTSGSSASDSVATFRRLKMTNAEQETLDDELIVNMQRARQDFVSQIEQFDLNYFHYNNYGRSAMKSWRFSPDSWFQVALQMAHYQLHNRLGPCYESASTRSFAYGRTETIRSLTKDVAEFCLDPNYETLRAAVESHKSYAIAATNGLAIDRVLLGYRMVFNELKANQWAWGLPTFAAKASEGHEERGTLGGRQLKFNSLANMQREQQVNLSDLFTEKELNILGAFFNNQLFERSKRFSLSTSQVSSREHPEICTSFGPIVPDGYACCYNLSGQQIVAAITANSSNQSFSCEASKFGESLRDSLDRMRDIVVESRSQHEGQDGHQRQEQQHQQNQRF